MIKIIKKGSSFWVFDNKSMKNFPNSSSLDEVCRLSDVYLINKNEQNSVAYFIEDISELNLWFKDNIINFFIKDICGFSAVEENNKVFFYNKNNLVEGMIEFKFSYNNVRSQISITYFGDFLNQLIEDFLSKNHYLQINIYKL